VQAPSKRACSHAFPETHLILELTRYADAHRTHAPWKPDSFRLAHPGVISCRPQSKCPVRPSVRWEIPSLTRLACIGCLAASLQ
jgi:hypothetical protein